MKAIPKVVNPVNGLVWCRHGQHWVEGWMMVKDHPNWCIDCRSYWQKEYKREHPGRYEQSLVRARLKKRKNRKTDITRNRISQILGRPPKERVKDVKRLDNHKEIDGVMYRKCKACKQWLPETLDNFYYHNHGKNNFSHLCRECKKQQARENQRDKKSKSLSRTD